MEKINLLEVGLFIQAKRFEEGEPPCVDIFRGEIGDETEKQHLATVVLYAQRLDGSPIDLEIPSNFIWAAANGMQDYAEMLAKKFKGQIQPTGRKLSEAYITDATTGKAIATELDDEALAKIKEMFGEKNIA